MRLFKIELSSAIVVILLHIAAAADEPILLKVSSYLPRTHHLQMDHQWVASEIETRTNGKIKMYRSASLHTTKVHRAGSSNITLAYPIYNPTGIYLNFGGGLPFKLSTAINEVPRAGRAVSRIYQNRFVRQQTGQPWATT